MLRKKECQLQHKGKNTTCSFHWSADWYPVLGLIRPQAFGFSFMSLMSEDTISFTSSCRGTPVSRSFHRGSQRVKMTWKQNKPLNKNTVEPLVGTEMLCLDLSIVVYRPADNDWTSIVCGEPKCAQIIKKCVSVRFIKVIQKSSFTCFKRSFWYLYFLGMQRLCHSGPILIQCFR